MSEGGKMVESNTNTRELIIISLSVLGTVYRLEKDMENLHSTLDKF